MQIDQKKVPVFHGEKDKDTITVLAWCHRIDGMKDALAWSDAATYTNAMAALFGCAQRTAEDWVILYPTTHAKTWTYLRKKMISHYGNMTDSRSYLDAMFSIAPRANNNCNLDTFVSNCLQAFGVVKQTIVKPDQPPPAQYTAEQVHEMNLKVQDETLNQICMSFMVNLLPPEIRAEVSKKKPDSMAGVAEALATAAGHAAYRFAGLALPRPPSSGSLLSIRRVLTVQPGVVFSS